MCTFILGVNSRLRCNFQPLHNLFISMSFLWLVDFRAVDWLDAYTLQFYDTHAAMRFWLPSVYLTYTHTRTYSGIAVQIWNVNGPAMQMHLNVQTAVKVFHVVVMLNKAEVFMNLFCDLFDHKNWTECLVRALVVLVCVVRRLSLLFSSKTSAYIYISYYTHLYTGGLECVWDLHAS